MAPSEEESTSDRTASPISPSFYDTRQATGDAELEDEKTHDTAEASRSTEKASQASPASQHLARLDSAADKHVEKDTRDDTTSDGEKVGSLYTTNNSPPTDSSASSGLKQPAELQIPDGPHSVVHTLEDGPEDMSRPPPLNYTLHTRKLIIAVFWTLIVVDSIGIPVVLYFCLDRLTTLSPNAVFSISTGCLGGISIFEYALRFWRLWKKGSTCRVIGARRWYLDWFHWNFSIAWIFIMIELIVGTVFEHPPIRVLAMPVASLLWWFAFELLTIDVLRYFHYPALLRISSVPKGAPLRPAIYSIVEDICAVDGSGGTEFRTRLNARYVASHYFRQMLHRLTLFWAFGTLIDAILTTALVFGLANNEIAYVIGWSLPFVFTGFMVPPTFWYVFRCLRIEYATWPERHGSA